MIQVPLEEAAYQFDQMHDQLTDGDMVQSATLTENGKPVLAVIPWALYEALLETAQVPTDPRMLLAAPPHIRERALAIAAARAEQEYYADPALTDFEAFGEDDLLDATE